jgi:hypothetical protein
MNVFDQGLMLAQENGEVVVSAAGGFFMVVLLLMLAVGLASIAGMWKTFAKAGKPGWGVIIPIYNVILMLEIAGRPVWWLLLLIIPGVNLVIALLVALDIARNYGKGTGFGLGLFLFAPIFYLILGFGDAKYQPVQAAPAAV